MMMALKPFEEMSPGDYANIGLKCGLEVHRQLLTRTKLFCRCPAGRYSDEHDTEILRHMRPTLSELGEYDGTALMEKKTRKNIYYRIHHDTVCTYEFDDTPPFPVAQDALDISIELSLLLNLNLVDEFHVARKQYLDGSIPTGFQRTTILGISGWIPYKNRKIGITQLSLEEDACREVSDIGHDRVYLTDRLGMPLVEIVTDPDMRTPQETADVGQIIRRLCHSTGKVRTGYGAARQDVNVSVRGGTRVEIKGVPQLWRIPRLIYNEARRQCSLLGIREILKARGITPDSFRYYADDVTRIVAKTKYEPMRTALAEGQRVKAVVLKGFGGLLNEPTQEHTTFAKEFSDRIRVVSCLTRLPNMVHSDTASESLYGRDWQRLRKRLKADEGDALVLVWGDEADAVCACEEIALRGREATTGVPSDTRQAIKDGTNGFERVLPGANRMYPDTDLPPQAIPKAQVDHIATRLPELVWDREARYRALGLAKEHIEQLFLSPRTELFSRLVDELGCDPTFAAVVLCQRFKSFRRKQLHPERLTDDLVVEVFRAYTEGRLAREGVVELLRGFLVQTGTQDPDRLTVTQAIEEFSLSPVADAEWTGDVERLVQQANPTRFSTPEKHHQQLMGLLMRDYRGRADGDRLAQALRQKLKDVYCQSGTGK